MLINRRWGRKVTLPAWWPKEQVLHRQPEERFALLFPHLTEALETVGRICQLELLCFAEIIFSVFK